MLRTKLDVVRTVVEAQKANAEKAFKDKPGDRNALKLSVASLALKELDQGANRLTRARRLYDTLPPVTWAAALVTDV